MSPPTQPVSIDREVEKRLGQDDVRYTSGRKAVVHVLAGSDGPKSAAEIHEMTGPSLPLSSLYRSLSVLEASQILVPHHGARGLTRYELAEWLSGHHHHLVCIVCGSVEDVELTDAEETRLVDLVRVIGDTTSFTPLHHALEVEGKCGRCA